MQRFLEHVTDLRLLLLVQGISLATGWSSCIVNALKAASAAYWLGCNPSRKARI